MRQRFGAGTIMLPAPAEVEELMRHVPRRGAGFFVELHDKPSARNR
jgi:hypothetical protein